MEEIIEAIKAAQRPLVLAHDDEDADAVGSLLAMCAALSRLGKKPAAYLSCPPEERLEFLNIEIPVYNGGDADCDLCIALDCGDKRRLGKRAALFDKCPVTINIDHHYTNDCFAQLNFVNPNSSSTGEILAGLIPKLGIDTDKELARYLYCAIVCDSGCFKYSCTTPETLMCAARLLGTGIDHAEMCRLLFDTRTEGAMRLEGYVMSNLKRFCGGKVTAAVIDEADYARFGVSAEQTGDIVDIARSVKGTVIAMSMKIKPDCVKLSFRSNDSGADVSEIARHFGGGGHKMAAGAAVKGISADEIIKAAAAECAKAVDRL